MNYITNKRIFTTEVCVCVWFGVNWSGSLMIFSYIYDVGQMWIRTAHKHTLTHTDRET